MKYSQEMFKKKLWAEEIIYPMEVSVLRHVAQIQIVQQEGRIVQPMNVTRARFSNNVLIPILIE